MFCVTKNQKTVGESRVHVTTSPGQLTSSPSTAEAGTDYEEKQWTLVFTPDTPQQTHTIQVKIFGDEDHEHDEHFWVRSGTNYGQVTIRNDDLPDGVWAPSPYIPLLPQPGVNSQYLLVDSPVYVWLQNVAETCEPVTALPLIEGTEQECGDDVWPRSWSDSTLWDKNLTWKTSEDGSQEAVIYVADRIEIDRGDGTAPHVCWSDNKTTPAKSGDSAPGRRLTNTRLDSYPFGQPQPGECMFKYSKSGTYDLKVTVIWNEYVCQANNPETTTEQLASNPVGLMTCGTPVPQGQSHTQKLQVYQVHQTTTR